MKNFIKKIDDFINRHRATKAIKEFIIKYHVIYLVLPILLYLLKAQMYHFNKSHAIEQNLMHTFNMGIDNAIPFCKYFIVFYVLYYAIPQVLLWVLSFYDKKNYWILLITFLVTCFICNIIFYCHNIYMVRPDVSKGNDIFIKGVRWVYGKDVIPYNCFPSIHAVAGALCCLCVFRQKKIHLAIKISAHVVGIGLTISTVFIKQHYFIDMVVGFILMIAVYYLGVLVVYLFNKYRTKKINPEEPNNDDVNNEEVIKEQME